MTESEIYSQLNERAVAAYDFDKQIIMGNIINTMLSHSKGNQRPILEKFKEEWDEYQDDVLKTISDFESKAEENEKLLIDLNKTKHELEHALNFSENEKQRVSNELELMQATVRTSLMGIVVKISLAMICGIILLVSGLYLAEMYQGVDDDGKTILANLLSTIFVSVVSSAFAVLSTVLGLRSSNNTSSNTTNTTNN